MAELYNKVGLGLLTWSPVSLGLALGSKEEQKQLFTKLALKVLLYDIFLHKKGEICFCFPLLLSFIFLF